MCWLRKFFNSCAAMLSADCGCTAAPSWMQCCTQLHVQQTQKVPDLGCGAHGGLAPARETLLDRHGGRNAAATASTSGRPPVARCFLRRR